MKILIKKIFIFVLALTVISLSAMSQAVSTTVDVLVVYTKGTTDLYGSDPTTRFNQIFQVTNQIYSDSNVDIEIRLVGTKLVDYTDNNNAEIALNDITYARVPAFSGIAAYRDQVKADMVIFYRPYMSTHGSCGIAWIGGSANGDFSNPEWKKYMYAHVAISSCGDYVTAHELGHNMGLKHSRKQDGSGGVFPYALGYGVDNLFTDIMAYQTSFNVDYWTGKLYKFSNPDLLCKGVPCGIDRNNSAAGADAHYALNITAPQIAKFNAGAPVVSSSSAQTNSVANSVTTSTSSSSRSSIAVSSSSSAARSSVSNVVLDGLLAKVTSTKAAYDAAVVILNANTVAVSQKAAAEAALLAAVTKATTDVAKAKAAYDAAVVNANASKAALSASLAKVNSALASYKAGVAAATTALKAAQTKIAAALAVYNKAKAASQTALTSMSQKINTAWLAYSSSPAATKAAKKKIYDDLVASSSSLQAKSPADDAVNLKIYQDLVASSEAEQARFLVENNAKLKIYNDLAANYSLAQADNIAKAKAVEVAKAAMMAPAADLTQLINDYKVATKATTTEKAKTAALTTKVNTTLSAYNTALAAYNTAKAVASFNKVTDVAQYGGADWSNEVSRSTGLTLDQAKAIAAANPNITYFFITKGVQMVLGTSSIKGVFHKGDTVFFSGTPWYGSAPGLADAYEK